MDTTPIFFLVLFVIIKINEQIKIKNLIKNIFLNKKEVIIPIKR